MKFLTTVDGKPLIADHCSLFTVLNLFGQNVLELTPISSGLCPEFAA